MKQIPSWEGNIYWADQNTLRVLRNPKVHYPTRKSPPLLYSFCHSNPFQTLISCLFKINFILSPFHAEVSEEVLQIISLKYAIASINSSIRTTGPVNLVYLHLFFLIISGGQ
jgi:hypothetical protein